jgi:hypothetical protein
MRSKSDADGYITVHDARRYGYEEGRLHGHGGHMKGVFLRLSCEQDGLPLFTQ